MRFDPIVRAKHSRGILALAVATSTLALAAPAAGQGSSTDPRIGLAGGWMDAESAARGMTLVGSAPRAEGLFDARNPGDLNFANSDLAFRGDLAFQGNFGGFQIFDISDPSRPRLRTTVICPGGQGDMSIWGDLLFMSVEQPRGRVDCGSQGVDADVSPDRFRGVRIFDVSDVDDPRQIAAVQTCRGSHTHTLVKDPDDDDNLYVYVSGTGMVRSAEELEGCRDSREATDPNSSYWSIGVIQVPLADPAEARLVNEPRVFADPETGEIAGLWPGGEHGEGTQRTAATNQCHDITAYPEIGLAAGACAGNGILLDISDPVNPVRIEEVSDPNFAYWHSATFSNDGSKLIFTDEWGGGTSPRCRASDAPEWGADAIFTLDDGELEFAGYYKLPVPQTEQENCVAHNGSLVPVPGRDIMAQAWYQGGVSVFDFTDPGDPVEIAFFDRGPLSETELMTGGYWSAYWYNGRIYGAEIARGLDVFELRPGPDLSRNEIEAARLARFDTFNAQMQPRVSWPAEFVVARAYLDQLVRGDGVRTDDATRIHAELARLEAMPAGPERSAALRSTAADFGRMAEGARDPGRVNEIAAVLREMAG